MIDKSPRTTARLPRSWTGSDVTVRRLSKTWFFRLSSLAFISIATPALNALVRGALGFLPMIAVAIFAGLLESSFNQALRSIRKGISENKLLVVCLVWYLIGVVFNALFRGNGLDDWRLMVGPAVSLIGMCFAFAFMGDNDSYRLFQIGFLLAMGIQMAFSIPLLTSTVGIVREMWLETQGSWIYGGISDFALLAILFPIFVWRSLTESGVLRVILIVSCVSIIITILISSLATPSLLVVIGALIVMVLTVLHPIRTRGRLAPLLVAVVILTAAFLVYRFAYNNPLLDPVRYRVENLMTDLVSGGYDAETARTSSRFYLADISARSFRAEPLWGMGGGNTRYSQYVGGHSSLMDTLGSYGLLGGGGALLGVILAMLAKATMRFWGERNWETLFCLTTVVLLVVGGIVDPFWEGWLLMYVLIMARPFLKPTRGQETKPLVSGLPAGRKASTSPAVMGTQHSQASRQGDR